MIRRARLAERHAVVAPGGVQALAQRGQPLRLQRLPQPLEQLRQRRARQLAAARRLARTRAPRSASPRNSHTEPPWRTLTQQGPAALRAAAAPVIRQPVSARAPRLAADCLLRQRTLTSPGLH